MATIRSSRIGQENIKSIKDIEEYINSQYLQQIQNRIEEIKNKRRIIEDKLSIYNSLNNTNNLLKQQILNDIKYTTIVANQQVANNLIDDFNKIIKQLTIMLEFKDSITTSNLLYKQDIYDNNKVSVVDGEFITLEVPDPKTSKSAITKSFLISELLKLEQPPSPLQPLKSLATNEAGNLIWK